MKFRRNKILCTALLAGAIACGAMAAQTVFAVAEESVVDDTFAMMGASVRFNEPTGIRFGAKLGVGAYVEPTDGADTGTSVSYGVAIFPVDLLVYCGIDYAEYNPNLDYVSAITVKGAEYFEYMKEHGKPVVYETESVPVPVYAEDDETKLLHYEVYGSIGNVLYDNLARDFFGIAYQKTTTSEGDGVTVSYRYASFENGINVRSVAYVASAAYEDTTSEEKRSVLNDFLNRAFLQQSGVSEDAAASAPAPQWTAALSQSSLKLYEGGGAKLSAQGVYKYVEQGVDKEVKIDLGASSWTSGNAEVVSVDSTGAVKALSAGKTQITAKVGGKTVSCEVEVLEREEAPYTVTVTGGEADKQKAAEDETVTLTVNESAIPEGKRFSHWTMNGERIEGDSFVMPAGNVSVEAVYVTEFSTIEIPEESSGGAQNFEGSLSEGDKVFTLNVADHPNQQFGETWAYDVFIPYEGTQNTISFTLRNISSSHELNLCIFVQKNGSPIALSGATTGGTLENNNSQVKVTIPQNGSQRVSITASAEDFDSGNSENKKVQIVLRPLAYQPREYVGKIELSEILFGDAGSVLPESEYSVTVNGGFADKTKAKAGETVTLTPDPKRIPEGMVPGGWMMNGETVEGNSFVMPAKDVTVTAVYRFSYTISVEGGIANKTNAVAGETITLTPDPDLIPEGMVFGGWMVNGKTVKDNFFEMPAKDVTVTAVYVNDVGTTTVGDLYVVPGSEPYYSVSGNTVTIKTVCPSKDPDYKSVAFNIYNYDSTKAKYVRVTVTNNSDAVLGFSYKAVAGQEEGYGSDKSVESGETVSWTGEAQCGKTGSLTMVDIFFWGGTSGGTFTVTIEFSSTPFADAE